MEGRKEGASKPHSPEALQRLPSATRAVDVAEREHASAAARRSCSCSGGIVVEAPTRSCTQVRRRDPNPATRKASLESNVRRVATLRAARQDERAKRCRCLHLGVLALVAVLCASDATAFATHAVCGKRGGSLCVGEGTAPSPRAFWARAVTVLSSVSASSEAR